MYPPSENDNHDLIKARKIIERNVDIWLSEESKKPAEAKELTVERTWKRPAERNPLTAEQIEAAPKAPIELSKMKFPKWEHNKKIFLGRPPHGFLPPPDEVVGDLPAGYETGFFLQPVDHFDNQNPDTFLQKYYKNSQWARPGGPNFLKIGGEGPESPSWVLNENITYITWARKFGATVYSLEHRYYGDSVVGGHAAHPNPNLKYLSSVQMLYDLARYIQSVKRSTNNTAPWIVFGGSYAGNLALWMRQLFPDLVLGAVGSSAPVEAKLDFYDKYSARI
ncbi:serine carboxypeptidase S28 [Oesophagostomum dentatum]|uniref:Serine carboxypeptidase S28 n=1 Tax=Oesophagostomum dentatum TaxID=61180 RepID=A0A0B1TH16_OESDE|nr:serine carboxypeptidase S28 [Oesophagostomum dentatum]